MTHSLKRLSGYLFRRKNAETNLLKESRPKKKQNFFFFFLSFAKARAMNRGGKRQPPRAKSRAAETTGSPYNCNRYRIGNNMRAERPAQVLPALGRAAPASPPSIPPEGGSLAAKNGRHCRIFPALAKQALPGLRKSGNNLALPN